MTRSRLLALTAALALLAGCSSADDGSAAGSGSTAESASSGARASSSASADAEAEKKTTFCADVPPLLHDISSTLQGITSAPGTAPQVLDDAVRRLSAVQPPADATPQWQRLVAAWTAMRDLLAQADLTDPAANAHLAPQLKQLQTELIDSGNAIDAYGKASC